MAKKILFAEDEETLQKAMKQRLTEEGYEVLVAHDGETAIEMAKKEKPDLVLLDLILPKKDGFEVLEEMKADEKLNDIPVVVLTNLETNRDIQRVLDAGATTYLVKANYEIDDVLDKLKNILHK
ncbi:MAG: response regulator [Candidatus Spechtbacterales bacterium]|nr:response regulator [Candidatus Spechtbacterales bacterium]